jgi:hypothetical protein
MDAQILLATIGNRTGVFSVICQCRPQRRQQAIVPTLLDLWQQSCETPEGARPPLALHVLEGAVGEYMQAGCESNLFPMVGQVRSDPSAFAGARQKKGAGIELLRGQRVQPGFGLVEQWEAKGPEAQFAATSLAGIAGFSRTPIQNRDEDTVFVDSEPAPAGDEVDSRNQAVGVL